MLGHRDSQRELPDSYYRVGGTPHGLCTIHIWEPFSIWCEDLGGLSMYGVGRGSSGFLDFAV